MGSNQYPNTHEHIQKDKYLIPFRYSSIIILHIQVKPNVLSCLITLVYTDAAEGMLVTCTKHMNSSASVTSESCQKTSGSMCGTSVLRVMDQWKKHLYRRNQIFVKNSNVFTNIWAAFGVFISVVICTVLHWCF